MRRRGVGAGAIVKKKLEDAKYKERGNELATQQLEQLSTQLEAFHSNLEEFAAKHKQDIRKDPQFRQQFQKMCAAIGVDPLASGKGFWSEMLGVGDFYYELGIQAIEICIATRAINGGLMTISELYMRLKKTRSKYGQDLSLDDVQQAIKKLKVLGTGFALHGSGANQIVRSIPSELNMDHTTALELAQTNDGHLSVSDVQKALAWKPERARDVLEFLTGEGMAWIDDQASEPAYWFPALFVTQQSSGS